LLKIHVRYSTIKVIFKENNCYFEDARCQTVRSLSKSTQCSEAPETIRSFWNPAPLYPSDRHCHLQAAIACCQIESHPPGLISVEIVPVGCDLPVITRRSLCNFIATPFWSSYKDMAVKITLRFCFCSP